MTIPIPLFEQHADRTDIQAEVHARPPLSIDMEEAEVWHWVIMENPAQPETWPPGIDPNKRHQVMPLTDGLLRFERHTEFVSLTFLGQKRPSPDTLRLIGTCSGRQLAGSRVLIRPEFDQSCHDLFTGDRLYGGSSVTEGIQVATDFQVGADAMVNYVVTGFFIDPATRGLTVKWIMEMEMYRMAALLGLPEIRRATTELGALEHAAAEATRDLSEADDDNLGQAITSIADILSRVAVLRESLRYRIAASRAYNGVVEARLESLAEQRFNERRTLKAFVDSRLTPAISTINAFDARLNQLDVAVRQTMSLARTRLDFVNQEQSAKLLMSMETRARQQVHLAQAVEGLSVAAITYYAVGLIGYILKGIPGDSLIGIYDPVIVAVSIPTIAILVWRATRAARKKINGLEE